MFSDESDTEDFQQLTINEHYAKAFEYRKEREELEKLKDKYGSDYDEEAEEEDSEDLESEDEDGEELTPAVDAAILRTLARIKRKDPAIYQDGKDVFEEEFEKSGKTKIKHSSKQDASKPLTIRQHVLASQLHETSRSPSPEPLTHVQEQEVLRKETISAFHDAEDGDDEDDLLVLREKTKDELEREEEEYQEYLKREVGEELSGLITLEEAETVNDASEKAGSSAQEVPKKMKEKRSKSGKNKQEEDQEFLMNYILNRGWIDRSAKRLPTYKEITSGKGKGKARAGSDVDENDSADDAEEQADGNDLDEDEFDDVVDRFETSYNFRFEEPGADQIARFPRNIGSTVRREDSARKEARAKRKARKEEELLQKKEEVKRLKSLKMKEVRAKLERIGREGGKNLDETEALEKLDLDSDWDADEHDKRMAEIYGQDDDGGADEEKPQWDDDIDITDIVPAEDESSEKKKKKKKKKKSKGSSDDEAGVNVDEMDADVVQDEEEWDGTEEMRKRKIQEYMDEVYNLDFNDMVAGMPTRFKYTKVQSQAYALTPAEIILATDAELNQYMGIKKYAPYRKDSQNWDKNRAARLKELKERLQARRSAFEAGKDVTADAATTATTERPAKKRKGKKERMREKAAVEQNADEDGEDAKETLHASGISDKRKRPVEEVPRMERSEGVADVGEDSLPPKKKRRRQKKAAHTE